MLVMYVIKGAFKNMNYQDFKKIIGFQKMETENLQVLYNLLQEEKGDIVLVLIKAYHYGFINGKISERQKTLC